MNEGLTRAAVTAYRVLLQRQITKLPVNPLALLKACRQTRVLTEQEVVEKRQVPFDMAEDALTFVENGRFLVIYRDGGNPARLNFTLAHELGHRLLHPNGPTASAEREADLFASHLLCPRPALAHLARRFCPLTAEQVAATCYVSVGAARQTDRPEDILLEETLMKAVEEQLADYLDTVEPIASQPYQHPLDRRMILRMNGQNVLK